AAHGGAVGATALSVRLQGLNVPPMISFDEDLVPGGRRISGWIVAAGGAVVGWLAAIMGVGGGFVTFPMFVYIFGVSSMTTVGTDILQIIFTAGLASIGQYAIYGYVFYTLAIGMLLGSLLGIQIGALTTKVVKGVHIRGFYAVSIIAGFINRAATLPKKLVELEVVNLSPGLVNGIEYVGNIVFWVVVAFFGLWVFGKFFANLGKLRAEG
ncbi:MAG: sulfite exporter TauE/SafE family protein, partial [Desulfovibrionaceae bacterium]|nr:sulfite exporter TauE/SafE family protein [Desulfovibrionaceae bacterium]